MKIIDREHLCAFITLRDKKLWNFSVWSYTFGHDCIPVFVDQKEITSRWWNSAIFKKQRKASFQTWYPFFNTSRI